MDCVGHGVDKAGGVGDVVSLAYLCISNGFRCLKSRQNIYIKTFVWLT
jgi:hypothetical protein